MPGFCARGLPESGAHLGDLLCVKGAVKVVLLAALARLSGGGCSSRGGGGGSRREQLREESRHTLALPRRRAIGHAP